MGIESYQLGAEGEEIARRHLQQNGFEILESNYRSQQGEIDIIARDKGTLVFVEVKNYSFRSYGTPQSAVRKSKRESVIHAAHYYLYKHRLKDVACRFDVVAIYLRPDGDRAIEQFKNAFMIN